ncbi:hypothetical protein C2E23DRAFT_493176 [Lenzites betulinus]|nr:hypothetical protein C2E23DRAFT_493176 [Lenzites betulinus]
MTKRSRYILSLRFGMKSRNKKQTAKSELREVTTACRIQSASSPILPRPRPIPIEIVEMILEEAWLSVPLPDPAARWAFFRKASFVNNQWHEAMLRMAVRHVRICLRSNEDLAGYLTVGRQCMQREALHPGFIPASTSVDDRSIENTPSTSLAIPDQRLLCAVFRRSSWSLYVPYSPELPASTNRRLFPEQDILQLDRAGSILRSEWAPNSISYLPILRRIVPDCKKITIHTRPAAGLSAGLSRIVLGFIASLPSVTHLDFDTTFEPSDTRGRPRDETLFPWERVPSPLPSLPRVHYLRFKEYPNCTCQKLDLGFGHAESYCFAYQLTSAFPSVVHLHIDTPMILKHVKPPPRLHTLTLEVPRARRTNPTGLESVMEYNLAAALNRGLLEASLATGRQCKAVFKMSTGDPAGWSHVVAACRQHGVTLVRQPRSSEARSDEGAVCRTVYIVISD